MWIRDLSRSWIHIVPIFDNRCYLSHKRFPALMVIVRLLITTVVD
jgi:hypothetical protein